MAWWDPEESGGGGMPDWVKWSKVLSTFTAKIAALQGLGYTNLSSRRRDALVNARVGGDPRSQHLIGTAADFVVRPDQVSAFTVAARKQGLVVVNEMNRPGHGAHMHVQMFPKGQTPSFAPFPKPMAIQIQETP